MTVRPKLDYQKDRWSVYDRHQKEGIVADEVIGVFKGIERGIEGGQRQDRGRIEAGQRQGEKKDKADVTE